MYPEALCDNVQTLLQSRTKTTVLKTLSDEFQLFISHKMNIYNILEITLQLDQEALKEHEN